MQEFLVNQTKQIAVSAEDQEEALKKVLNGEGKVASMNMSATIRPQASSRPSTSGGAISGTSTVSPGQAGS